jgi:uncharacterized protein (DUF2164 family)
MESVFAAAAVVLSAGGSIGTSLYNSGKTNAQVVIIQQHQTDQDTRIDENAKIVTTQQLLDAAVAQKLDDMGKQLDRIEKKL